MKHTFKQPDVEELRVRAQQAIADFRRLQSVLKRTAAHSQLLRAMAMKERAQEESAAAKANPSKKRKQG